MSYRRKNIYKAFTTLMAFSLVFLMCIRVVAASVSVSGTNNGNGTYSVGVSTSLTGAVTVNSTNGSVQFWCEGGSCVAQGNATFSGTGTISISATPSNPMDDGNGDTVVANGSSTSINVTDASQGGNGDNTGGNTGNNGGGNTGNTTPTTPNNPDEKDEKDETKDSDSSLGSLSVSVGELSPVFASGTTSYEVNLPAGTTKLTVDAKAKSAKASVSGTGALDVKTGENNLEVVCTAENGSSTVYKIKVNVSEKPVATIKYGKKNLGVLNQSTDVSKLFTETKITIDGKEVIAWKNEALKMTLLYMQDEKTGEKNLYIYDEAKKEVTSIYKPFAFAGKNLVMVDIPKELQERKGMKLSSVKLGDVEVTAWVFEDKTFANYALLYVMDEAGNMVYYQYEKKENSLQLFSQAAAISQDAYQTYVEKMEGRNQFYLIIICVLALLSTGLLITTITLFIKRKNNAKYKKIKIENVELSAEAKSLLNKD